MPVPRPSLNGTKAAPDPRQAAAASSPPGIALSLLVSCLQHRVDRKTSLEETYGELKVGARFPSCPISGGCTLRGPAPVPQKLVSEGKIKYVGISEASPAEIRKAHSICPLTAIQIEYSLWSRDVEGGQPAQPGSWSLLWTVAMCVLCRTSPSKTVDLWVFCCTESVIPTARELGIGEHS